MSALTAAVVHLISLHAFAAGLTTLFCPPEAMGDGNRPVEWYSISPQGVPLLSVAAVPSQGIPPKCQVMTM